MRYKKKYYFKNSQHALTILNDLMICTIKQIFKVLEITVQSRIFNKDKKISYKGRRFIIHNFPLEYIFIDSRTKADAKMYIQCTLNG